MLSRREGTRGIEAVRLGFGKHTKLQAVGDFSLVFAARRSVHGEIFDLHYRKQGSPAVSGPVSARLGIVIAKKFAPRAVQRNLLKRLAREVFRLGRPELPAYDLVLRLAKPPGTRMDNTARKTWRAEIEHLLICLPR